jgi:hypothetical protein
MTAPIDDTNVRIKREQWPLLHNITTRIDVLKRFESSEGNPPKILNKNEMSPRVHLQLPLIIHQNRSIRAAKSNVVAKRIAASEVRARAC